MEHFDDEVDVQGTSQGELIDEDVQRTEDARAVSTEAGTKELITYQHRLSLVRLRKN